MKVRTNKQECEIVIVGAGPAGLCACYELLNKGVEGSKILVIDIGPDVEERMNSRRSGGNEYDTIGIGGAGLFSDGKLAYLCSKQHLFPQDKGIIDLWEALPNSKISEKKAKKLFKYAYEIYDSFGVKIKRKNIAESEILEMQKKFSKIGIHYEYYESRQIDAGDLSLLITKFKKSLIQGGIIFRLYTRVVDIEAKGRRIHLACKKDGENFWISCKYLILTTGKQGMDWVENMANKLGIETVYRPVQLGVRVEVLKKIMDPFTKVHRDQQLIKKIDKNTLVQTFCTCSGGKILPCTYDGKLVLSGYTDSDVTLNTNFALLVKQRLNNINAVSYGHSIVKTLNILGNGKPIVQRLGDLRKSRRSTKKTYQTTLFSPL